jgi:hypothetical protein
LFFTALFCTPLKNFLAYPSHFPDAQKGPTKPQVPISGLQQNQIALRRI